MYYYYPTRQPILIRDTELRIERRLPTPGKVRVQVNDRVDPSTIVAVAEQPGRPFLINIARELEVPPADARKRLAQTPGSTIGAGEPLAKRWRGLRMHTFHSPCAGSFSSFDAATGIATIVPVARQLALSAYVAGIVEASEPNRGVTIRAFGSRFYGAFGVGDEAFGVLKVVSRDRQRDLTAEAIDSRAARSVLAAGGSVNAAALQKAVQVGVKGIIVGSIEERELVSFLNVQRHTLWRVGLPDWRLPAVGAPLTIVVTEGFGRAPMAEALYETLVAGDASQVSLNGTTVIIDGLRRPEVLLTGGSGRGAVSEDLPVAALVPGATVRLIDHAHLGAIVTVQEAPRRRRLEGDLIVDALEVQLADGERLVVPTANVEVLV